MLSALIIFLVALAGGCLPLWARWNHRMLHAAVALSAGVFLGAVFLHMLPSISMLEVGEHAEEVLESHDALTMSSHVHGSQGAQGVWIFVLVGVLGVYLAEALVLRSHDHDEQHQHRAVGYAALVGLSIHAFTTGVGLSAALVGSAFGTPLLLAILLHKGFESFSLVSVFQLASIRRKRLAVILVFFSLVTPLGVLVGQLAASRLSEHGLNVMTALAAGTFLYVCLCELLPEVFHHREDVILKFVLLAVSIGAMAMLDGVGV